VIRSTLFEIREIAGEVVFVGSGHGHGVGMSQWGAQAMAKSGADHRTILAAFYPGTKLMEGPLR
jgi:stage II sporulation protein D